MSSITVRVDLELREALEAEAVARKVPLSRVVRERLEGGGAQEDRLDDVERRLTRLEEMAGL